jgi:hypothetical protein
MCATCAAWASFSSAAGIPGREARLIKWLVVIAVGVAILTLAAPWLSRYGLGHLPGDLTVRWRGRRIYLPFTSTLLLSLALTLFARLV